MGFKRDEPGMHASRTLTETGSTQSGELDLYDQLVAFSALSPEAKSKELERAEKSSDPPAVTFEEPAGPRFDFLEQSDPPDTDKPEFNQLAEPVFTLIDEAHFAPPDQHPKRAPVESVFAFVAEEPNETSQPIEGKRLTSESYGSLNGTSPLEEVCSGTVLSPESKQKCENCGAASNMEELFCPSCSQLLGDIDL